MTIFRFDSFLFCAWPSSGVSTLVIIIVALCMWQRSGAWKREKERERGDDGNKTWVRPKLFRNNAFNLCKIATVTSECTRYDSGSVGNGWLCALILANCASRRVRAKMASNGTASVKYHHSQNKVISFIRSSFFICVHIRFLFIYVFPGRKILFNLILLFFPSSAQECQWLLFYFS